MKKPKRCPYCKKVTELRTLRAYGKIIAYECVDCLIDDLDKAIGKQKPKTTGL